MEEIFDLIKDTEEFKKYVILVEKYNDIPTSNKYRDSNTYNRYDFSSVASAMLENADIRKTPEQIEVIIENMIGELNGGEKLGYATYSANLTKENDDIVLSGNIVANFISCDNSAFIEKGLYNEINELVMNDTFENKFENMGYLYPSRTR